MSEKDLAFLVTSLEEKCTHSIILVNQLIELHRTTNTKWSYELQQFVEYYGVIDFSESKETVSDELVGLTIDPNFADKYLARM